MGLLAFGVFLGSATSPLAQSAGIAPILLDGSGSSSSPSSPTEEASAPASTPEVGRTGGALRSRRAGPRNRRHRWKKNPLAKKAGRSR